MKTKLLATLFWGIAATQIHLRAENIDSMPPVVIKTVPEAGATDVSPGEREVRVTFSKEMLDQSWSWSTAWENSTPEMIGDPRYEADHKTCVVKVKLEPNKTYGWWLNSEKFHNFKDTRGHPAVPYLLAFATGAALEKSAAKMDAATGLPAAAGIDPATGLRATGGDVPIHEAALSAQFPTTQKLREDIEGGQYEPALQLCLAYHEKYGTSGSLIFLLSDWIELGRRYPQARKALLEIRDHDVREFAEGRGFAELFSEVSCINQYLPDEDSTYGLFNSFRDKDTQLAQQCYFYVESLLVAKGEYQYCYDHLGFGGPQGRFDMIRNSYEMKLESDKRFAEMQKANAARIAEINRQRGWTNLPTFRQPDTSASIKNATVNQFVGQTRQLLAVLVATEHKTEAEKILSEATNVLDDARLRSAISDAEAKLKK